MIAVIEAPGNIAFSRNPVLWKLMAADTGGNLYGAKGVRAELRVVGATAIPVGETLTITYTEPDQSTTSLSFRGDASPSSLLEIPSNSAAYPNIQQYYQAVADKIAAHPELAPFFKLYVSAQSLWIEAIELDNAWQVQFDATGLNSSNFSTHAYPNIEASTLPNRHRILFEVFFEQNYFAGDFQKVASLEGQIDGLGELLIDIQDILEAALKASIEQLIPEDIPYRARSIGRYYVRYREDYDNVDPQWMRSAIKKVLLGGVSMTQYVDLDFFSTLNANTSLLTWYPDGKNVSTNQPEYLAWYNYGIIARRVILEVKLYTATSAAAVATLFRFEDNIFDIQAGETAILPTGYSQLGIDRTDIIKYTVQVVDHSSPYDSGQPSYLSQLRTYFVDHCYYLEQRYLLYFNSFGMPEILRCVGNWEKELTIERLEAKQILARQTYAQFQYDQSWRNPCSYHSGYLSKAEVDALQVLLIYNQVYELQNGRYTRLHILDSSYQITKTSQFLHNIAFKATTSVQAQNYHRAILPIPPLPDPATQFPEVLGDDTGAVLIDENGNALGIN